MKGKMKSNFMQRTAAFALALVLSVGCFIPNLAYAADFSGSDSSAVAELEYDADTSVDPADFSGSDSSDVEELEHDSDGGDATPDGDGSSSTPDEDVNEPEPESEVTEDDTPVVIDSEAEKTAEEEAEEAMTEEVAQLSDDDEDSKDASLPEASEDDGSTDIVVEPIEDTTGTAMVRAISASAATTSQLTSDAVTVTRTADGATNVTTAIQNLAAGDVFVDKSLTASASDALGFDEALTVYASTQTAGTQYEVGNYILVLDMTTSICRADLTGGLWNALAKEASDMAKDICAGSSKNQVMIVGFSCDNNCKYTTYNPSAPVTVLLPMHNWSGVSGNLLTWSSSSVSSQDAALAAGTWSVGISSAAKSYASSQGWSTGSSRKLGNGTWTQAAMAYVGTYLENWTGDKANTNVGVILITDGIPNVMQTSNLYATYSTSDAIWQGTIDSNHSFIDDSDAKYDSLAKCAAYTMRTVAYWKNKLSQEYNKIGFYAAQFDNGVYSSSYGLNSLGMWFVGIQTGYSKIATATSTGKTINYGWPAARNNSWYNSDHTTPSGSVAPDYTSKSVIEAISNLGSVSASPFLGMYTKTASLSAAQITDALANVFADIEDLVKSQGTCQPLKDGTYVTFTTKTNKYMTVQDAPTITYRGKSYSGTQSGNTYTYSIAGYSATVSIVTTGNTSTVTAKIPAEMVNANAAADLSGSTRYPIQVKFHVSLYTSDYKTLYSQAVADSDGVWNASKSMLTTYTNNYSDSITTVTYTTDTTNPSATYAKTNTVTSNKSSNATETLAYISNATIALTGKQTSVLLGNNGKLAIDFNWGAIDISIWEINHEDETKILPGVQYHLADTSGSKIILDGSELSFTSGIEAQVIECVPAGSYLIVADSVPDGYVSPDATAITVKKQVATQHYDVYVPTIMIDIVAIDAITEEPLDGITATVYDENGEIVYQDVTLEYIREYVPAGDYTVQITHVPDRYVYPDNTPITVQAIQEVQKFVIPIEHLGSITVTKYDADGKTPLDGVTFELSDGESNVLMTKTTDSNGQVVFIAEDSLAAGDYIVTETKTVSGHSLLADSIKCTIPLVMTDDEAAEQNADTSKGFHSPTTNSWYFFDLTYDVTNSANFFVPMTGGNNTAVYIAGMFAFVMLTVSIFYLMRRKKAD